jgi:hypothetical protein
MPTHLSSQATQQHPRPTIAYSILDNFVKKLRSFGRDISNYGPVFVMIFLYLGFYLFFIIALILPVARAPPSNILLATPSLVFVAFVIFVIIWGIVRGHIR